MDGDESPVVEKTLLRFPLELRLMIHKEVFDEVSLYHTRWDTYDLHLVQRQHWVCYDHIFGPPALLITCKQLRSEALPIHRGPSRIVQPSDPHCLFEYYDNMPDELTPRAMTWIRVVYYSDSPCLFDWVDPDLLPNLDEIRVTHDCYKKPEAEIRSELLGNICREAWIAWTTMENYSGKRDRYTGVFGTGSHPSRWKTPIRLKALGKGRGRPFRISFALRNVRVRAWNRTLDPVVVDLGSRKVVGGDLMKPLREQAANDEGEAFSE